MKLSWWMNDTLEGGMPIWSGRYARQDEWAKLAYDVYADFHRITTPWGLLSNEEQDAWRRVVDRLRG